MRGTFKSVGSGVQLTVRSTGPRHVAATTDGEVAGRLLERGERQGSLLGGGGLHYAVGAQLSRDREVGLLPGVVRLGIGPEDIKPGLFESIALPFNAC